MGNKRIELGEGKQRVKKVHPANRKTYTEAGICAFFYDNDVQQWYVTEWSHIPRESALNKLEECGFRENERRFMVPIKGRSNWLYEG